MADVKDVLVEFNKKYQYLIPKQIYKIDGGYIICAPRVQKGTDYGNPYYYVSDDFKRINVFSMVNYEVLFKALNTKPIWTA